MGRAEINRNRHSLPSRGNTEQQIISLRLFFFCKTKDHPLTVSGKYFPKPFVQQFFLEGLSQHPRHPGRWQGNAPRPGLERFELELAYLASTFLLMEYLDSAQTSKVSYSQIFLRLVMRYQSLT